MKRRILSLFFAAIIITTSLAGCSKVKGTGAAFSYPISAVPASLDPQIVSNNDAKIIVNNCFEGLVRLDSEGKIVCAAAEDYTVSDNGLEYTFNIRKDAKWHLISSFKDLLGDDYKDTFNTNLTADDFVFAFRRALNPQTASENASLLYPIKNAYEINHGNMNVSKLGVYAVDQKTLKIELARSDTDFLSVLARPVCMPCNQTFFDATGGRYGRDVDFTLCNGPFYLSKITEDASVLLNKNPDYSGLSEVYPSSVTFRIPDTDSSMADKINAGSLSAAVVSSEDGKALSDKKDITVLNCENIVWSFCFNGAVKDLQNYNLRRALCSCIDKNIFSSSSFNSGFADRLLPPVCVSEKNNISLPSSSNPGKLWQSALNELGKGSISLTVLCAQEHEFEVRALLQAWQKTFGLSCTIKINVVDRASLEKALSNKNYEIIFAPIAVHKSSGLDFLGAFAQKSSQNVINYSSGKYSDLLSKATNAKTSTSRNSYCAQAEQLILNDCCIYPVFYENSCFAMTKDVSGINVSPAFEMIDFISAVKS